MYPRISKHFTLRTTLAFTICAALLPFPGPPLFVSGQAQGLGSGRAVRPRPGKPEGTWPDLDQVQNESHHEHEIPPAIPSTIRARKNPLQPWDGRRVGDPAERGPIQRAHAHRRIPPTESDDQFVQNFFNWAVLRAPSSDELTLDWIWVFHYRTHRQSGRALVHISILTKTTAFPVPAFVSASR